MSVTLGGSDYQPGFDARREVWRLLGHLTPEVRIKFLSSCCEMVSTSGVREGVTESDGTVNSVFWDLQTLCFSRGLNLDDIGVKLVRWVKRFGVRPGTKNRPSVGYRAGG